MVLLLIILLLILVLKIPWVQNNLAQRATKYLSKKYNTSIVVDKVDLSGLKDIKLKDIVIKDHHDYPFIQVAKLETSVLNYKSIMDNELALGAITLDGLDFVLKTYKGESTDNINVFVEKFEEEEELNNGTPPFLLSSSQIKIKNSRFYLYDENTQEEPIVFYEKLNTHIDDFKIEGPNVYGNIRKASFVDNHQIEVEEFATDFTYSKEQMFFNNTNVKTKNSNLSLDMVFSYELEDLSDFNNKVLIEANVKKASVALIDLHNFYNELGKRDKINFTTNFKGTLNDFRLENLKLVSNYNSTVNGDFVFKNAFSSEEGFSLRSEITDLTSDYNNLTTLLPNILGKTLPSNFKLFGRFTLKGQSFITNEDIDAQLEIVSDLGTSISDLKISNIDDIDNAAYDGKIALTDFDLGKVINDSLVGKLSMVADVKGRGFTKERLNTSVKGHVSKHQYKGYTYNNIDLNGVFKNEVFNGDLKVDDEYIKMTFQGLANLSRSVYEFDFKADVAYADFNKLNLFKKHSKSILKGKIDIKVKGNDIDNLVGEIRFKDASYINQLDQFNFTNFDVTSNIVDQVHIVKVNSKDIVNGKMEGKFKFRELPKLAKNSLASIYTHYKPDSVSVGQYLDFNFKIYDKIIGVFYPEIKLGKNTFIRGKINSDKEKFELTFRSPKVEMKENLLEKIRLQIDNKNPLYNTILSVDKFNNKHYNIADLNLVNVTLNDTLFVQTDFKGGKDLKEKYNLSLFHTINKDNKSVVGFKRSDIEFKEQMWYLNQFNDKDSKVVFDSSFENFDFKRLQLTSGDQKLDFLGSIKNKTDKNLHLNFNNILLGKILPKIDSVDLKGVVNGEFNYQVAKGKTIPKIDMTIDKLKVNNIEQGDLSVKVQADEAFKKYDFKTTLLHDGTKKLNAIGQIDTEPKESTINAMLTVDDLGIKAFSPLGGDEITNIRGRVSGNTKLAGLLKNPEMLGKLFVEDGGLSFPYLGLDYRIEGKQKVTLHNQDFNFNTTTLIDTEKQTQAILKGKIKHTEFEKWFLDLEVESDNLLVLNTKEDEEVPYYGTALIEGGGTIKGYTDELTIDVIAKTNAGTEFIVPLSDVNTIEENKLVKFINTIEDKDLGRPEEIFFEQKGLTLIIDLEVTPDALAEIVIDKGTGSVLRGKGFAYLGIEINTTGKFEMFGTYIVDEGEYQLKNIVNKNFKVKQGGKITWNGSPFDAFLDIEAVNKVKANPSILLENVQGTRDIDVDLITKITGNLYEPQMKFDITLPKASSIVQSELAFKINDEDKKMTQFLSLLSSNTFINFDDVDFANSGNSFLVGTLSERFSSAISNILRSKDDKFQVGVNLELGDENRLNNLRTDDQVGVTLQTKILKKVTINGVVGVPLNSNSQSGVTGEIEAELPLNKAENFKAKMYNRRNEVEFDVLDTEGYTQGLGLSYQFNWDTTKEFLEKTGIKRSAEKKEKIRLKKEKKKQLKDSLRAAEKKKLVNFTVQKEK